MAIELGLKILPNNEFYKDRGDIPGKPYEYKRGFSYYGSWYSSRIPTTSCFLDNFNLLKINLL